MAIPSPRQAEAPFNDSAADVILRTSDLVDFSVNRFTLSLASPIFRDMFEFGRPTDDSGIHPTRPIIQVSESSTTLERLLRLCYPVHEPVMSEVSHVADVLAAATKYDMEFLIPRLLNFLRKMVDSQPLGVYALACQYRNEELAAEAALKWRGVAKNKTSYLGPKTLWSQTLAAESFVEEMKRATAGELHRLLASIAPGKIGTFCAPAEAFSTPTDSTSPNGLPDRVRPDVILQSSDGIEFPSSSAVLSLVSPELSSLVTACLDDPCSPTERDGLPVLIVAESGSVLEGLLALCYTVAIGQEDSSDMDHHITIPTIRLAMKYNCQGVQNLAKRKLKARMSADPLEAYFIFAQLGWKEECRQAAILFSRQETIERYSPQMENVSASVYHGLLKFRHEYRLAVCSALPDSQQAFSRWNEATTLLFRDPGVVEYGSISPEAIYGVLVSRASMNSRFGSGFSLGPEVQRWKDISSSAQHAISKVRIFVHFPKKLFRAD